MNLEHSQEPIKPASQGMQISQDYLYSERFSSEEYASLIIRMWVIKNHGLGDQERCWRSEVEHIQSGRHLDFSTLAELERFLSDFLKQMREINQV